MFSSPKHYIYVNSYSVKTLLGFPLEISPFDMKYTKNLVIRLTPKGIKYGEETIWMFKAIMDWTMFL